MPNFSKNYVRKKNSMKIRISELIEALEKVKEKEGDLWVSYHNKFYDSYTSIDEVRTEFWDEPHNNHLTCILM